MLRVYVNGYLVLATLDVDRAYDQINKAIHQHKPAYITDQDGHILESFSATGQKEPVDFGTDRHSA